MYSKNRLIAGTRIIRLDSVDSTNAELSRRVTHENLSEGTVIQALYQTAGRGQAGNSWHSEPGQNLMFSMVIYPHYLAAQQQFLLSMAVAAAVQQAIARYVNECTVKWPNDIYSGHRKLGGILIENALQGNTIRQSIIGIGLNVNQQQFESSLPNPASVYTCGGLTLNCDDLLEEILDALDAALLQLRATQLESISSRYHQHLFGYQQPMLFEINGTVTEGVIEGVAPTGELLLRINNELRPFRFKQIKYLLNG